MISIEKVKEILIGGIDKIAAKKMVLRTDVKISFGVNIKNSLQCVVYVKNQPEIVSLTDIIGFNFYNFMVKDHLVRKINHLASDNKIEPVKVSLVASFDKKIIVTLLIDGIKQREVDSDELI